jgi:hypothetical protein
MLRFCRPELYWVILLFAACCGCGDSSAPAAGDGTGAVSQTVAALSDPEAQARAMAALKRDGAEFLYGLGGPSAGPVTAILRGRRFGDAQVVLVSSIPTLTCLYLSESAVTDEGLKSLQKMPHLKLLYLEKTAITNLAPLAQMPSLSVLDVTGTSLREADLAALAGSKCKGVTPFSDKVVSAWLVDADLASSPWVNSKDGVLSLRLLVSAKAVPAGNPIVVLAELRNNTGGCVNVLRPFGDFGVAPKALRIVGPAGAIASQFPNVDYVFGAGAFAALLPGETIRDRLDVDAKGYPKSNLPGKYVLQYPYRATTGHQEQAAQEWINLPNLWVGEIESGKVSLVKEK